MGGGRLSREEKLRRNGLAVLGLIAAACALPACAFGGDGSSSTPNAAQPPTETPAPPATPTPDRLATPPASHVDARGWLQAILGPSSYDPPCPPRLLQNRVACAEGDVDGDGVKEFAYLVPVSLPTTQLPYPSAVFLRRGASQKLEEFAFDLTADSSLIGVGSFALGDRTGDGKGDLTFLENRCSATSCKTSVVVLSWDGNAWRDVGPGDSGIANVDSVVWEKSGSASVLKVHGGRLPATAPPEAGPSRASTTSYALTGSRYAVTEVEADPPEYYYHAFLDADAVFERDKAASLVAFESLLARSDLKDWKARPAQADRRRALEGFALFRLVLANAVLQKDQATVTAAIDRVILQSAQPGFEPLFVNVAMEFRRGYTEQDGLIGGCAAVNLYLSRPVEGTDTRAYVEQLFNYGYANPPGSSWLPRICPF